MTNLQIETVHASNSPLIAKKYNEPLAMRGAPVAAGSDAARWQAVLQRDSSADGTFVFGVLSTGVYCRPSCPARRPLRKNVRFFTSPREAEGAGLRACLRCKPADASAGK